jgi:cell division protein FtsI (penicillin-binding protein 3)
VVGFTNREGRGSAGIEARFDSYLAGKPGTLVAEVGSNGQIITSGVHRQVEAVPGSSVRLTLSEDLQYVAQSELDAAVRAFGARGGQIAVLDAHTAEVLALAVSPSQRNGQALLTDPAVSDVFEPGSVNKVVTFAAAVEHNLITPDTVLQVPGSIRVADRFVRDAWSHGPVNYTATGVLAKSSNVGTLMIAQQLGEQRFYDYMRRFGLGQRTGVELPGESRGILPPMDQWSGTTFGNLPIGQGVSMTILQLASMYQALANDGVRVPPRLVSSFVDANGRTHPQRRPAGTRVVSAKTAQTMRYMLEAVTQKGGTAPSAAIEGYRVAGKTGTAQQPDPRCHCYTDRYWATFAGMAPADDPQVVIAVMIDDASGGQHGGQAAGPLFRTVMTYALKQRGIPPTGSPQPTFRLIAD